MTELEFSKKKIKKLKLRKHKRVAYGKEGLNE